MSKALATFDFNAKSLPAHLRKFVEDEGNIQDRVSVPSLGITGKVFAISLNGETKKLVKVDEDGDEIPVSVFRAVILDYAKKRGRQYFEGAYDPNATKQPLCWSDDGVAPHSSVPEDQRQSKKCETCPLAVKGSKVTDANKAVAACGQFRMVALVPANNLAHEPLRLKLAVTSDWDKNDEWAAQGFFGFSNYTDFLRTKGVKHTAALVTKMRFDPNEAYPKLLFSPDKWLTEDQLDIIKPILASDEVKALLNGSFTPAGVDGKPTAAAEDDAPAPRKIAAKAAPALADDDDDDQPVAAPAKKKKAPPVVLDGDDEDVKVVEKPKPVVAKGEKFIKPVKLDEDDDDDAPVAAPAKKAKAAIAIDDEDDDAPVAAKAQPKAKAVDKAPVKAAQATTSVPDDVNELIAEWDE